MNEQTRELYDIMYEKSFKYQPDEPFTLVSGNISPLYFDCRATLLDTNGLKKAGTIFSDMIESMFPNANLVGGLTMGADPISYATALYSTNINPIVIRKEAKEHGTKKQIEGEIKPGDSIVIVDDVITTGGSTIKAIRAAREEGLNVLGVVVLVDREEFDGVANIKEEGVDVYSVFTASEFIERYEEEVNAD